MHGSNFVTERDREALKRGDGGLLAFRVRKYKASTASLKPYKTSCATHGHNRWFPPTLLLRVAKYE